MSWADAVGNDDEQYPVHTHHPTHIRVPYMVIDSKAKESRGRARGRGAWV